MMASNLSLKFHPILSVRTDVSTPNFFYSQTALTAMMRRIDQVTSILVPMVTGQVMSALGLVYSAFLIAAWNILSVLLELYLMWKVYTTVPALKATKDLIVAKSK